MPGFLTLHSQRICLPRARIAAGFPTAWADAVASGRIPTASLGALHHLFLRPFDPDRPRYSPRASCGLRVLARARAAPPLISSELPGPAHGSLPQLSLHAPLCGVPMDLVCRTE